MKEDKVPTTSFFLIKHISEEDEKLSVVGTMIQTLYDPDKFNLSDFEDDQAFFQYRFNEVTATADSDMLQHRRTEKKDNFWKRTYQVKTPLETDVVFDRFPFQIVRSTLQVELSSDTTDGGQKRLRPNLHMSEAKTNNVSIQPPPFLKDSVRDNDRQLANAILDKMDRSQNYDFITPCPRVEFMYEVKKAYCPKYRISFYLVKSGMAKFVENVLPMLLISAMNTVCVLEKPQAENADFVSNSATFALTAVFILPNIVAQGNRQAVFTVNNLYITLIFLGLTLSSLSESMVHSRVPSITGMIILWCSLLVPICNCMLYLVERNKILRRGRLDDYIVRGKRPDETPPHKPDDILEGLKNGVEQYGFKIGKESQKMKMITY